MRLFKRFGVPGLVLAAVLGVLLAACGSGSEDSETVAAGFAPAPEGETVEISIWFGREQFIPQDAFRSFMAEYPHIRINADVIPLEQIPAAFIRDFQAGAAPDIIQPDGGAIANLSIRGMLYDTTPIMESWQQNNPDLFDVMTETAWEMASYNETPHGLALHHGVFWNLYRSDVFAELGVDPPRTWEEVLDVGQLVSENTDMYGFAINGSRDQTPEWDKNFFAQMGGEWVNGVMQIDSEAGHYWLHWYQRAMQRGVIDPDSIAFNWPDMIRNFSQGRTAMATISRNVFVNDIQSEIEYGGQWDINPQPYTRPGGESNARYITNGWPYLVSSATNHPYEVGLVLQYLADDTQAFSVARGYQPVSNSRVMSSEVYFDLLPWGEILVEPWGELEVRPYHINQAAMDAVIRDAMQEALTNPTADVRQMAEKYQLRLDNLAAAVPGG